jgi:predicted nucleic acid-binding protein
MPTYLLDTNALSLILKKRAEAYALQGRLQEALKANAIILMSPVVYYEVKRGLHKIQAEKQLVFFEEFISCLQWRDLTKNTWEKGAQLWASCARKGVKTGNGEKGLDGDVLIAAQAQEHNATVITNNVRHFDYLGVNHESW